MPSGAISTDSKMNNVLAYQTPAEKFSSLTMKAAEIKAQKRAQLTARNVEDLLHLHATFAYTVRCIQGKVPNFCP